GTAALDIARQETSNISAEDGHQDAALACAMLHDAGCFRAALAAWEPTADIVTRVNRLSSLQPANALLGRWDAVLKGAPLYRDALAHAPPIYAGEALTFDAPLYALAAAHTGNLPLARNLIEKTPVDCVICLRARARIEALAGNARGADMWFT